MSSSSPLPKNLLDAARARTTGVASTHKHVASRVLVVDAPSAGGKWLPRTTSRRKEVLTVGLGVALPALAALFLVTFAHHRAGRFHRTEGVIAPDHIPATMTSTSSSAPVSTTDGARADASMVIARMRPTFRKCYAEEGLARDQNMSGNASFFVRVAVDGHVSDVMLGANDGLSKEVTSCISNVITKGQFAAGTQETTLRVPVTFIQTR